jgi:type II secretory pathway pseudopilin PulG
VPYRLIIAILATGILAAAVFAVLEVRRGDDQLRGARGAFRQFLDAVARGDREAQAAATDGLYAEDPLFACTWADPALGQLKGKITLVNRGTQPIAAVVFDQRDRIGLTMQKTDRWRITDLGVAGSTRPQDLVEYAVDAFVSAARRGDRACVEATLTPRARQMRALTAAWTPAVAAGAGPARIDVDLGPTDDIADDAASVTFPSAPPLVLRHRGGGDGGRWLIDGLGGA